MKRKHINLECLPVKIIIRLRLNKEIWMNELRRGKYTMRKGVILMI